MTAHPFRGRVHVVIPVDGSLSPDDAFEFAIRILKATQEARRQAARMAVESQEATRP